MPKVKKCFVQGNVEDNNVYITSGLQPPTNVDLVYRTEVSAFMQPFSSGGCYSDDVKVLTDQGWKYFKDLNKTEKFYTMNPETEKIELQSATKYFEYDFDGDMIHFQSRVFDLLVTPNHNMVYKISGKEWKFKQAEKFLEYTEDSMHQVKFPRKETCNTSFVSNRIRDYQIADRKGTSTCYEINIKNTEKRNYFTKITATKQYYKGKVYCVTVPNHTLFVKRKKSPTWCGNSIEHVFLGGKVSNKMKTKLIQKMFSTPLNYMTLSPTLTLCTKCNTKHIGEHYKCPNCKSDDSLMIYSRIIGYVRPIISGKVKIENNMINGDENYWQDSRRVDWIERDKVK